MSRRILIGSAIGVGWAAAVKHFSFPGDMRVSVIGKSRSQLALVDMDQMHTVVCLGAPEDALLRNLPLLMTLFRQHLDLAIGSEDAIMAIQRHGYKPCETLIVGAPRRGNAAAHNVLSRSVSIDCGSDAHLNIRLNTIGAWSSDRNPQTYWSADLRAQECTVAMAATDLDAVSSGPARADIVIVPAATSTTVLRKLGARALATNESSAFDTLSRQPAENVIPIFPDDVAAFGITSNGVTLPSWAHGGSVSSSRLPSSGATYPDGRRLSLTARLD